MKPLILLLALTLSALGQVSPPPVRFTGPVGPGGNFPLFNAGTIVMPADADYNMQYPDTSASVLRVTTATGVTLSATRRVIVPSNSLGFEFTVQNATAGNHSIIVEGKTGTGVTIPNGQTLEVVSDGINYVSIGVPVTTTNATWILAGPTVENNPVPPTIVQSKICTAIAGTSVTCAFTSATTAGNTIIVGTPYHASAVSDNLSQTYSTSINYPYQTTFYKENSAAGVTATTTTVQGPGGAVVLLEVSQLATTDSLDQDLWNLGNITGANTPITFGRISTSNPADFILGFWTCSVNSATTPTAAPGWTLGGYSAAAGNSWSAGFVWQNATGIASYEPTVLTANCPQQQWSMSVALKASLVGSTGPAAFRPLEANDLPNRPWSSITDPPPDYLTQVDMSTGATYFKWNIAANNSPLDLGFGMYLSDASTTNPDCTDYPLPDTPACRNTVVINSNQPGVWPLAVNSDGGTANLPSPNYSPGFHVNGTNGNIVMQAGSTLQLPNLPNVAALGTDANGNVIAGTTGGPGSTSWSSLTNPTAALSLTMGGNGTTFNYNFPGAGLLGLRLMGSNSIAGTPSELLSIETNDTSNVLPLSVNLNPSGKGFFVVNGTGDIQMQYGSKVKGPIQLMVNQTTPVANAASLATDANGNIVPGTASSGSEVIISMPSTGARLNGTTPSTWVPFGSTGTFTLANEPGARAIMPLSGTIAMCYAFAESNGVTIPAGASWTWSLLKNGAACNSNTVIVNSTSGYIANGNLGCSFVAGDGLSWRVDAAGGPPNSFHSITCLRQ